MKRQNTFLIFSVTFVLLSVFILSSCKEKEKQEEEIPEIPVFNVLQQDLPVFQKYVGQIYGYYDIPIRARVAGFLEGIHFTEGSMVHKGDLLYTIDPKPLEAKVAGAESQLAEAQTMLAKAQSDLERIKPLAKMNAVSKSDLDAAVAQYEAAKAAVDAARSELNFEKINLGYCWVKSPIDGLIGKTKAKVGEFVGQNPNPVILNTVSTLDSVHVQFYLSEDQYLEIARKFLNNKEESTEARDNAKLKLILADGTEFKYPGFVDFINREVDPQTGSLLVQATFPNPDILLRPGQYAKVVVPIEIVKNALLVPQRCVMEQQGRFSVFVVNAENKVENRQVETGVKTGDMWLITKGLQAGDKVVIDALQMVKEGMTVKPVESDFKPIQTQEK